MIQYKTIALDRATGKAGQKLNAIINPISEMIQNESNGGWEFVKLVKIPIYVKPGCIMSLLGSQGSYDYAMMVIFKKEDAVGAPLPSNENATPLRSASSSGSRFPAKNVLLGTACLLALAVLLCIIGTLFSNTLLGGLAGAGSLGAGQASQSADPRPVIEDFSGISYVEDMFNYPNCPYHDVVVQYDYSDFPKGCIFKQIPAAGTLIVPPQSLTIFVSLGDPFVAVPDLTGHYQDDALSVLKEQGFASISIAQEFSSDIPAGCVIRSSPAAGETTDVNKTLTVYISLGSETRLVLMPKLVGLSVDMAICMLTYLPLDQDIEIQEVYDDGFEKGCVVNTSPRANSAVVEGQSVILFVSKGPAP